MLQTRSMPTTTGHPQRSPMKRPTGKNLHSLLLKRAVTICDEFKDLNSKPTSSSVSPAYPSSKLGLTGWLFVSLFLFFLCVCLFYTKVVDYAGFVHTLKVLEKWSAVFKTLKIWKCRVHWMPLKVCELDFLSESDMPMILSVTLRITTWIASDLGWLSLSVNYNHSRAINMTSKDIHASHGEWIKIEQVSNLSSGVIQFWSRMGLESG